MMISISDLWFWRSTKKKNLSSKLDLSFSLPWYPLEQSTKHQVSNPHQNYSSFVLTTPELAQNLRRTAFILLFGSVQSELMS